VTVLSERKCLWC